MKIRWEEGFRIQVTVNDNETLISANREGLLSLAKQLRDLAEELPGSHIHYDEYNSLEKGSSELVIEKKQ